MDDILMTAGRLELDYYQVDAFAKRPFEGNPAAVFVLDAWLDDAMLLAIAAEHNLSETAFVVPRPAGAVHALRWFTPTCEVELCGHATLASAYVLLHCLEGFSAPLRFVTRHAGTLGVSEADGMLWLDLPACVATPVEAPSATLAGALGARPTHWRAASNHLAIFDDAATVAALVPDMAALAGQARLDNRGVIATAPADDGVHDFVSRYFAPGHGVDEDPVTGSAHCTLAPYWARRLGRTDLTGRQISRRGGTVACRVAGERVHLGGHAVHYAYGQASVPMTESA